ncbi:hypothetical protein Dimus_037193 [Dionaea muscipula]
MTEAEIHAGAGAGPQSSTIDSKSNSSPTTEFRTGRINQNAEEDGVDEVMDEDYIYIRNFSSGIGGGGGACPTSEIEEVDEYPGDRGGGTGARMAPIREEVIAESSMFSFDINGGGTFNPRREEEEAEDAVFVVVEEKESSQSSMDALMWTLKDGSIFGSSSSPSSSASSYRVVYLIHVFPEVKFIPSPLGNGKVPRSQVRHDQVENYLTQERGKRRRLLEKFIDKCTTHKVKAETILIESNDVANAVLELVSVLHVPKLVIGVSKANLRKLLSRRGNGVAVQLVQNAPHWCVIKCICEGRDAFEDQDHVAGTPSPKPSGGGGGGSTDHPKSPTRIISSTTSHQTENQQQQQQQQHRESNYLSYCCFRPNASNE